MSGQVNELNCLFPSQLLTKTACDRKLPVQKKYISHKIVNGRKLIFMKNYNKFVFIYNDRKQLVTPTTYQNLQEIENYKKTI